MSRLFAVIALVFFFLPIGLRAVGVTADPFENRRLADPPKLSQGWDAFAQTTAFFTDRMPLREQAVEANTWIARNVFDTTPDYSARPGAIAGAPGFNAQPSPAPAAPGAPPPGAPVDHAVEGTDGWLYLQAELELACARPIALDEAMRRWQELVQIVRDSGRRAVFVIAPDKASVSPQHLPSSYPGEQCQDGPRREQQRAYEVPDERVVPLRKRLLDLRRSSGKEVYYRKDTHWNPLGAFELVRAALPRVSDDVRVRDDEVAVQDDVSYSGDLTALLGQPTADRAPAVTLRRAGDAPVIPGRTLFVRDSFGLVSEPLLKPYAADLVTAPWDGVSGDQMAAAIHDADTIVFETAERLVGQRAADTGLVNPAFLDLLRARLAQP